MELHIRRNIDDFRESPALDIIQILEDLGSKVDYYDPYVPIIEIGDLYHESLNNLDKSSLAEYDALVIVTNHKNVDYDLIRTNGKLIIDTRNVYYDYEGD